LFAEELDAVLLFDGLPDRPGLLSAIPSNSSSRSESMMR
jgi:hypothetical protein